MAQTAEDNKGTPLYDNLRKLITIVDELKDVGVQQYIKLPRIVVIGTQSAGKSSLLESIVGLDFLPRGEGVVTRRPLELRLVHVSATDGTEFKPYAEFPQDPNKKKFYNFDEAREKIIQLTDQVAGNQKGIIDNPITMTIYSQNCPDLTLVDLPGITRIPLPGQDIKIEEITKGMCRKYAKDPRTVILCVMPANQDMSTSDALQMAREEDPEGIRTIGVFTKIDIMDNGVNARRMLLGQEIPLKLGYVGVKGRSQYDINHNMKVSDALKKEKEYFDSHPQYSTLPPGHVGTEALTQKLTKVLFGHIRNTLPEICKEIANKIRECEERLRDLGEPMPSSPKEKMHVVWNMITDFTENFKNNIRGRYDPRRRTRVSGDLSGGAKIKQMFQELYSEFFDKRATENMTDEHINKAIVLHQGDSIPGFLSLDSFLFLMNPLLKQLKNPAIELLNNVHIYLESIASELINKVFVRFPSIIDDITDIVNRALLEEKEITKELVESVIESERTYIFTNDIQYLTERTSFVPPPSSKQEGPNQKPFDPEKIAVDEMRLRVDAYFSIVLRNIRDTIPKVMGNFLVKSVQEKMQYALYNEINKNEQVMDMLGEPPHIMAERETLNKVLSVLRKARIVLTKDPDLAPTFKDSNPPLSEKKMVQSEKELKPSSSLKESSRRIEPDTTKIKPVEKPIIVPGQSSTIPPKGVQSNPFYMNPNPTIPLQRPQLGSGVGINQGSNDKGMAQGGQRSQPGMGTGLFGSNINEPSRKSGGSGNLFGNF